MELTLEAKTAHQLHEIARLHGESPNQWIGEILQAWLMEHGDEAKRSGLEAKARRDAAELERLQRQQRRYGRRSFGGR